MRNAPIASCWSVCHTDLMTTETVPTNPYTVGSLTWIERNNVNSYRGILTAVLRGEMTKDEARQAVWALDTDSASF